MDYTGILSNYAAQLRYEQIPEQTVLQTKKLILHVLSAALASTPMEQAKRAMQIAAAKGGEGTATVWGAKGQKTSAEDAAFANATMADILDWEDCSWTGHPSAGAVSVALAVGEAQHLSGKRVIEAIVAAYDVYQRIAMSMQPKPEDWGVPGHSWGLTSWQVFAGAVAAAKLYGFDEEDMATCLGVTTHFMAIPGATREDSDVYHYAHGICARNGIAAAEIVKAGVDPIRHTLDGPFGLWRQLNDTVDTSWYDKELGTWFAINDTLFKHWPANMWIQAPLDALDHIMQEAELTIEEIEKVEVSPEIGLYSQPIRGSRTVMKAEFNLAYCFAAYLQEKIPSCSWYSAERLENPDVVAFEKRFAFLPPNRNPLEQFMIFWTGEFPDTTVSVVRKDGKRFEKTLRYPKGHPKNPFTWEEECAHFERCAVYLSSEQKKQVIDGVWEMEKSEDISDLCALLGGR